MNFDIGAPSAGRSSRGLGLPRRPGRGVLLVECGLILVLAAIAAGFGARVAGTELSALFAVAANTL